MAELRARTAMVPFKVPATCSQGLWVEGQGQGMKEGEHCQGSEHVQYQNEADRARLSALGGEETTEST